MSDIFTSEEVAKYLKVPESTIRYWTMNKEIPFFLTCSLNWFTLTNWELSKNTFDIKFNIFTNFIKKSLK